MSTDVTGLGAKPSETEELDVRTYRARQTEKVWALTSNGRRQLCPLVAKGLGAMLFLLAPLPQKNSASICPQDLRTHSTAPVQPKAETRS